MAYVSQPPPSMGAPWSMPYSRGTSRSSTSDAGSARSIQLPPLSASGPFIGSPSTISPVDDAEAPKDLDKTQKTISMSARASSLPPPSLRRRPPRRRTQEAREIIAMQKLLPQLMPDGEQHGDGPQVRPHLEQASSYDVEQPRSPDADAGSELDIPNSHSWQTPATDHPLTAAESADMLERVRHDLLGMDIAKLKGSLADIARKESPLPATQMTRINPRDAFRTNSPQYRHHNRSESLTVSPKEAFLDYDAVSHQTLGSLSPSSSSRERIASPMPSLFAPLAGQSAVSTRQQTPTGAARTALPPGSAAAAGPTDGRAVSPPFGMPVSHALMRGVSNPSPRSPATSHPMHVLRRSMEPEAAPRNAVKWISAKREPVDWSQLMAQQQAEDGQFDWSPSSEEAEGGLALENPPTPPPPRIVSERPMATKADILPFSFDQHPLSGDLAYIHHVPEAPTFRPPSSTTLDSKPPMVVRQPPRTHKDLPAPPQTPTESGERSTLEDDDDFDETARASDSEEWRPSNEIQPRARAALAATARLPATPETSLAFPPSSPGKKRRASLTPTDDAYEDEDSSDYDIVPAKQRRTKDGTRAPPRPRQTSSKFGDGAILCDYIDLETGIKCNTPFRRPYDLARHKDTKHTNNAQKPSWVCDTCHSSFSRRDALMRHARLRSHKMP